MSSFIKKIVVLAIVMLSFSSVFAAKMPSTNEKKEKDVVFSLAIGADGKYKMVDNNDEKIDFLKSIVPSLSLTAETNGNICIPMKYTVNLQLNKLEFWKSDSYLLNALAEIRLLKLDSFRLFLGAGVNYDNSLRTEENEIKDAIGGIASCSLAFNVSKSADLVCYTYVPFATLVGAVDQARGLDSDKIYAPASVGLQLSFRI